MKTEMNRREFLKVAGCALAVMALPVITGSGSPEIPPLEHKIRVRPLSPETATESELAFCTRARFKTAADAMRACAARDFKAEIYEE